MVIVGSQTSHFRLNLFKPKPLYFQVNTFSIRGMYKGWCKHNLCIGRLNKDPDACNAGGRQISTPKEKVSGGDSEETRRFEVVSVRYGGGGGNSATENLECSRDRRRLRKHQACVVHAMGL